MDVVLDTRPDQLRTLAILLTQDYLTDVDAWIDLLQPTFRSFNWKKESIVQRLVPAERR
jgi:hypothetical protein